MMECFSEWVFADYIERELVPERKVDDAVAGPSNVSANDFQLPSGKSMNLYKYLKWLITNFGHDNRESLIKGALAAADTSTFEKALTHPLFDSVCSKAFAVDKSLEVMQGFRARYEQIKWDEFDGDDSYLSVEVSMRLIRHLLDHHEYGLNQFIDDVWSILTLQRAKTNLLFVHGVPNSGKSFIIRSLAALYKYSATVQGTTSFPFMELAHASLGLIEEPSFTDETLQTFKKLAEGTPTEVSVKNKRDAHVVYHGANTCSDKKPWSRYEHFHLTFISKCRPGLDTMWANVVAQHKAVTKGCQIPNTQITKFPGSWANYLTQSPRITWRVPVCQLMDELSMWVFAEYVDKEPTTTIVDDGEVATTSGEPRELNQYDFKLPSGKSMNLYKYLKWLVTTFGHCSRV